ncbi:hypothetical protein G7054_g4418 [Neopestalotiopsis clavispora]|nr:hypothetical protein G7054_g4418 [Neopestalotiopsis clavispora]
MDSKADAAHSQIPPITAQQNDGDQDSPQLLEVRKTPDVRKDMAEDGHLQAQPLNNAATNLHPPGFYVQYLESLCRRRGWRDPTYECCRDPGGYTCSVLVNGREYETDLAYECDDFARENAAMRAFMVCRNFSVNGGMLVRNGIVQGVPSGDSGKRMRSKKSRRRHSLSSGIRTEGNHRTSYHASSSSTAAFSVDSGYGSMSAFPNPEDVEELSISQLFEAAIDSKDSIAITRLLRRSFEEVARGPFSWIDELRQLGLSLSDIAEELLEQTSDSPWILSPYQIPSSPSFESDFHVENCLCADSHAVTIEKSVSVLTREDQEPLPSNKHISEESAEEIIDILCGLGGVRPSISDDRTLIFGYVDFDGEISRATVLYEAESLEDTLTRVLDHLSVAAGTLQQVRGCCNKFTYLSLDDSATEVQLHSLDLQVINDLRSQIASPTVEDISKLFPGFSFTKNENDEIHAQLLLSIVVQFISTTLLSYSRAHCGPLRPAFLDSGVDQIMLLGAAERIHDYDGPIMFGSLVNLACFGDMLEQPALAFRYCSNLSQALTTVTSVEKHNLVASPCDLLDTWGPGQLITTSDDYEVLHAIYVGGGCITATGQDEGRALLHWSREPRLEELPRITFSRSQKGVIGARVTINPRCVSRQQDPLRSASVFLHELGTYRDYWESAERQLGFGLQAGQNPIAALQLSQTWVKMRGMTKKSRMLAQLYKSDLEELYSVQVSVCTGVARRVSLRRMLAELLPTYVTALVSEPPLWKSLVKNFHLITALESGDLNQWAAALPHGHQQTFEGLVIAVLTLMRDTGIDKKGDNFVIGCIQPGIAFQCFQVPCTKENYWTRMLTDSDEIATFAYITMDCLETNHLQCRAPSALWANSTGLFWTAVACYEQQTWSNIASPAQDRWELRHSEAYIIGTVDTPLLVKVDRPNQVAEPRLLVSVSLIQAETLRRLFRKAKLGHKRRLRERRVLDPVAEEVFVLVGRAEASTLTS